MPDQTNTPDPSVMKGVIPYVAFAGRAAEAVDFYVRAFGASEMGRMPNPENPETLMHAQVEINGGALMMTDHTSDGGPVTSPLPHGHLQLMVADGRAWWDRALKAGCTEMMPYERQFWGDDWGLLRDPFGIQWSVAQPGAQHST